MNIRDLLRETAELCRTHQLVPGVIKEGPMSSGVVELRGKSRQLRIVTDRGEPSLEIKLQTESGPSWFDAVIIQKCLENELQTPEHNLEEQIKFMDMFLRNELDAKYPFLTRQLAKWQERRAADIFAFDIDKTSD